MPEVKTMAIQATAIDSKLLVCSIIYLLSFANKCSSSYYTRKLLDLHSKNAYATGKDFELNEETFKQAYETLNDGCLVHIINSRGLDLPLEWLKETIIVSRYASVFVKYFRIVNKTGQDQYERRTRIFPIEKFKNLTPKILNRCTVDANDIENVECVEDFPAVDHTSKAKPWTCERHFHLFPPEYIKGSVSHKWVPTTKLFELNIPNAINRRFWTKAYRIEEEGITVLEDVSFYIIVRERFDILLVPFSQYSTIKRWSTRVTRITDMPGLNSITTMANHELFVLPTFFNSAREQTVRNLFILCRFCKQCHHLHETFMGWIGHTSYLEIRRNINWLNSDLSKAVTRVFGTGKWIQIFLESESKLPIASKSHRHFHHEVQRRSKDAGSMPYFFEMELFERLLGNITTKAILRPCEARNAHFTEIRSPDDECECNNMMYSIFHPVIYIAPTGTYENADLYMHVSTLEFVSCGVPEKNSLSFVSLLWIFRTHVWMTIISSWIIVSLVTLILHQVSFSEKDVQILSLAKNILQRRRHYWHQYWVPVALTYLKGFFEQGGPLNPHLWKDRRSPVLHCLCLLMFMSLSTLYKNDNITELTLPRKPVPYDSFDKLIKHKFDVFTRPVHAISGMTNNEFFTKALGKIGYAYQLLVLGSKEKSAHVLGVNVVSELQYFAGTDTKYYDFSEAVAPFRSRVNYSEDELPYATQVQMNHTRVIANWSDYMFSESGLEDHLKILQRCNRTALLLPDVEALQLYHKMNEDKRDTVFKSKQPLYTHRHGVRILHWIPMKILTMGKLLKQSGILEWMREFFGSYMIRIKFTRNRRELPTASNLSGQIVVVLLIVPVGGILASLMFLVEYNSSRVPHLHSLTKMLGSYRARVLQYT